MNKLIYYSKIIYHLLISTDQPWLALKLLTRPHPATVRISGLQFGVRNFMDLYILIETICLRVYPLETINYHAQPSPVVIDVGAALGDFSLLSTKINPKSHIHSIEPESSSFHLLQKNVALNGLSNISVHNLALAHSAQEIKLSVDTINHGHSNSFLEHQQYEKIGAISLDLFFSQNHINRCFLLKSDCEGAEYDYLLHTTDKTLLLIDNIFMEYHLFTIKQRQQYPLLIKKLVDSGFTVSSALNPIHSNIGYLSALRKLK